MKPVFTRYQQHNKKYRKLQTSISYKSKNPHQMLLLEAMAVIKDLSRSNETHSWEWKDCSTSPNPSVQLTILEYRKWWKIMVTEADKESNNIPQTFRITTLSIL